MNADNTSGLRDALDFVNRQPCRCMSIAQLGERDYCDRCQSVKNLRALLARTEAGADGAVAYQHREAGTEKWYDCSKEYYNTLKKHPWDMATMRRQELRALYTHPQDASGIAEPRFKPLDRVVWTSKLGTEFRGAIRHINEPQQLSYWIDLDDGTSVQRANESDIAMQAKEAK